MPLSLLSYTSILGILSTFLIILVVFIDGFSKRDGPGSLWSPADTSFGIDNATHLGIAFGLFMAGVGSTLALYMPLSHLQSECSFQDTL